MASKYELNERIAIELFGWKWVSFIGRPTRSHPDYPIENIRVRQLLSAGQLANERWQNFLNENDWKDATGDEPLTYTYCSSGCSAEPIPSFLGPDDYLVLRQVRTLWPKGSNNWVRFEMNLPKASSYKPGAYSRAALKVLDAQ